MKDRQIMVIKKRTQSAWLLLLIVILPFLLGFLNEVLGLPYGIRYILDVAWMVLLLLMWLNRRPGNMRMLLCWVGAFAVCTLMVYVVQYQSALYYLWGLRNNFRFLIAFFAFAAFLHREDIDGYYRFFEVVFWIDVAVSLYQFFVLGLAGDHLGGIFSTQTGGNGYTNLFLTIVITRSMLQCLAKREKVWYTLVKCLTVLLVATLAEIKFFFVEFLVILGLSMLFTNFSWRKLWLIVGSLAAVAVFVALLGTLFPKFAGFMSWEFFLETGLSDKGYTSSGDLNRLNAITQINERWLTTGGQRVFGLGLGNCDTSEVDALNTPFFERYGDMHYSWLSLGFMYLECGWLGLIFYIGFFVLVFLQIRRIERSCDETGKLYCRIGRIMAVICILISAYNSSMRSESAYMAYFVLAAPFALHRSSQSDHSSEQDGQQL